MYSSVCRNRQCYECLVVRNKHTQEDFSVFFWEWSPERLQVALLVKGQTITQAAKAARVNEELLAQHYELHATCPHCGIPNPAQDWYQPLAPNESNVAGLPFMLPEGYPQTADGYLQWRADRRNPPRYLGR